MPCSSEIIPERLHWNGRQVYTEQAFLDEHCLYRLGNPIEFPSSVTAYSCKWSFLIAYDDVLLAQDPVKYNDFRYARIAELRTFNFKKEKDTDEHYLGWHKLSCSLAHTPFECDYSHCEINITHEIFEEETENNRTHLFHYTYDNWKQAILNGKSLWFKQLKADYKTELIKLFCYPLEDQGEDDDNENPVGNLF